MIKKLLYFLAIIALLIHIGVQIEDYRGIVFKDTASYLECREYYHELGRPEKDGIRMCHDNWSWWNYEIYFQKLFN